jgi:glycosyltransferase involved in cell wall biosynthesis
VGVVRIVNYHPRARVGDGGITNSVQRLSAALARAGADPVIAYDGSGTPHGEDGVTWVPVRHEGRGRVRLPRDLSPAFDGADVVVLNSAWTASNVRAGSAARRVRVPYVLAPRGAYDPLIVERRPLVKRAWWSLFERRLVAGAAGLHVFFADQQEHLRALGYAGPLVVAPNGVQVPPGSRWDGGSGGYVLYLGRFDPEHKGLDLLLQAVALLPEGERPQVRLHGPDWRGGKPRTVALRDRLGLQDHVSIGEAVYGDEKWDLVARCAGLVYPSRWEGFGNSLAEAAALGVPTLATPYPLARFLADRGAGFVAAADPQALAEGLRRLVSEEAVERGARARQVVADELTWDAVARTWLTQLAPLTATGSRDVSW